MFVVVTFKKMKWLLYASFEASIGFVLTLVAFGSGCYFVEVGGEEIWGLYSA